MVSDAGNGGWGKASCFFGRLIGIASSRRRMMEHLFKKNKTKYRAA